MNRVKSAGYNRQLGYACLELSNSMFYHNRMRQNKFIPIYLILKRVEIYMTALQMLLYLPCFF